MSKLPGYDSYDTLVINHAQMSAPVDLQAECQQQLLDLEGLSQASGEYLFLRELSVKSSSRELGSDIQLKLIEQNDHAIEGDSVEAENAQVVRFTSLGQLLAQLSLHIQMGRNDLWYWQSWQHLFEMPVGDALALLWSDYVTDLTDMVQVLAQRGELKRFWTSLSKVQGEVILKSVKRALGVDDNKAQQSKTEIHSTNNTSDISMIALSPWRVLEGFFEQYDKRLELASIIVLLRWRPDFLFQQKTNQNIKFISQQLCGNNSGELHDSKRIPESTNNTSLNEINNENDMDMGFSISEGETNAPHRKNLTGLNKSEQSEIIKSKSDHAEFKNKLKSKTQANDQYPSKEHDLANSNGSVRLSTEDKPVFLNTGNTGKNETFDDLVGNIRTDNNAKHLNRSQQTEELSMKQGVGSNSGEIYADRGAPYCEQGGVFYLLNFMARKTTQSLLHKYKAYESLKGPWGCLYRLADLLDKNDDAALDQFFVYRMGLDSLEELKQLPPLSHAEQYQQYAEKLYGSLVWSSNLLTIPAQIEYTSSHLDIHYPLHGVDLEVRRVGLDINPGWLPWLGQVVNFHYHAELTSDGVSH